jgi:cytochrome b6
MNLPEIGRWLDERLGWTALAEVAEHKTVPVHKHGIWYYLGGITLFLFGIQVMTGILLMLYYRPSADEAYESVQFIVTQVSFGWLIRSIHSWSANLMVGAAFVHLFSVYFLRAYRGPREVTWISGAALLFLSLGFGFSGYLLPWNELAYFATRVGTDIAGAVPLVGEWVRTFLRGGEAVTGGTLSRFYGWHVAILPAITTAILGLHLYLVQKHGMSRPDRNGAGEESGRVMPFVPNFLLRDIFGWGAALALLAALAAYAPWELGVKADLFAPAPADIRPEWYFMFMFETLKVIPGGEILGIEFEAFAIIGFSFGGLILMVVPFLDKGSARSSRILSAAGWLVLAFMVGMTAWGYRSLWPVVLTVGGVGIIHLAGARGLMALLACLSLSLLASPGNLSAAARAEESCVSCHRTLGDTAESLAAPVARWEEDVHRVKGMGCAGCHGGDVSPDLSKDAEGAMDPAKGYIGAPGRLAIADFCGRCHSDAAFMKRFNPAARVDQLTEYRTSVHGIDNAGGDERVATCIDCHGVHGILEVSNPGSPAWPGNVPDTCAHCHGDVDLMSEYGLDAQAPAQWRRSVHAAALLQRGDQSAPACNDCHGNHGASPPGVDSLAFVCGSCHGREAQLFRDSFKKDLFEEMEASECVTCHGHHDVAHPTDELIGTGERTVCGQCHEPGDECDQQAVEARTVIDRYAKAVEGAEEILTQAERAGMEVNEALFMLDKEGVSGLVETRALIHSFDTARLVARAEEGLEVAETARQAGEEALEELSFRRKGLALSLVFIGLMLAGLYAKIREVDRRQKG